MVAAATSTVLLVTSTGCAKGGKSPQTSLASAPTVPGVAPAGSVGPIVSQSAGSGLPTHQPQPAKSPPTSKPPRGGPTPSHQPTPGPPPVRSDFFLATTGKCYWTLTYNAAINDYALQIVVEFSMSYTGPLTVTTAPFTMTTNANSDHIDDDFPRGAKLEVIGHDQYGISPYLGRSVKVTGALKGTDDDASNNAASITVSMPTVSMISGESPVPGTNYPTPCS